MKKTLLFFGLMSWAALSAQILPPGDLRCEYKENPLGIDVRQPRLSWKWRVAEGERDVMQGAYRIQAAGAREALEEGRELIWDSGIVESGASVHVPWEGPALQSRQRVWWRVKVWDRQGRSSPWSAPAFWEMALLDTAEWAALWISPDLPEKEKDYNPPPHLRREFDLQGPVRLARLYITAHGVYEAHINGRRVGEDLFTPGWTSYPHRLQYQTYDVTELLQPGRNAIGVILGDGWYRGRFGFSDEWNIYGTEVALLCQLEVVYENGLREFLGSDPYWRCAQGPIRMSGIYDGETYDARLEMPGWSRPGFDDRGWAPVRVVQHSKSRLLAQEGLPVRRILELKPKAILTTPRGDTVVDMGQNMVGWVRLKVRGNRGDTVTLHHAEVLDKEGNFYTANLRAAKQQVRYVLKGTGEEVFEPHFTFQGFRYVKVEGFPGTLRPENITGIVIHSDMEHTGRFTCSDSLVNQLQHNIEWGQRGNFLDVPTDCPQRDERMGWTGDAQAFAPTACFNFNTAAFYTKWLADLAADQEPNGSVPFVVPDVLNQNGSTGWADAATIIPWTLYRKYADRRLLERQYPSMKAWVGYLDALAGPDRLVQDGFHFGDWLFFIHPTNWNDKPGYTDIDFIATAFFAHSTDLVRRSAEVLGKTEEAARYARLFEEIKAAFQREFVTPSGRLSPHSQTAYTLALAFGLLTPEQGPAAVDYLVQNIRRRGNHLSTGFLGTPLLCHVLSAHGRTDVAYDLLLQTTYPSWLYPVTKGATTIWERWDGIKPDGSFQTPRMNSFNHYAYGAVGEWMYQVVAGIREDPSRPGYRHTRLQPEPGTRLQHARAEYESLYGRIACGWERRHDSLFVQVEIPPNTRATLLLPHHPEGAHPRELGSGTYSFAYPEKRPASVGNAFSLDALFGQLWQDERARQVLLRHAPELGQATDAQRREWWEMSLRELATFQPRTLNTSRMTAIARDLQKLGTDKQN